MEFLRLLFQSRTNVLLVGDPRQCTYSTNNLSKNKKYKKDNIMNFFEDDSMQIEKDEESLNVNYRSCPAIVNYLINFIQILRLQLLDVLKKLIMMGFFL